MMIVRNRSSTWPSSLGGKPGCAAPATRSIIVDHCNDARAAHEAMAAKMNAEFDAEVAALRRELAESYAMMERMRTLLAFSRYERSESDAINKAGAYQCCVINCQGVKTNTSC